MVERITSRRSTLRTLPALREEALPRPRAQRMCRGVHTESSADRSEMGKIDRSRRRRGCAGALRHKICTASLDNRPLIDGFVLLARFRSCFVLSFALSTTSTRANWLRSGAFLSPRAPWGVERGAWSVISLTHRFTGHCSRATDHCSPATRHHHPLPPAGNWIAKD